MDVLQVSGLEPLKKKSKKQLYKYIVNKIFGDRLANNLIKLNKIIIIFYLRIGRQLENGFPVCPGGQLQIGLWLYTRQIAPIPQTPRHGS